VSITNPYLDHSIADLITRAKGLDAIYDAVIAGGGTTPEQVWTYSTRTLTSPTFGDLVTKNLTHILADSTAFNGADIATILSTLQNGTYGLSALNTDLDTLLTRLTSVRAGYLDNLSAGAVALASVCTETRLAHLDADISSRAPESGGNISAILTDTADMQPRIPRIVCFMDFWSENTPEIALTTTAGSDYNLPNCVVAGLPSGITIIRVVAILKIALIKDTSGSDNAINGATSLKVDSSSLYDSLVTAIDIPDNSWAVDVSEGTERGGDVMIGDNDVKSEVTGNGTYYGQLTDIVCDGNNLKLKDVAWGLRIFFTV
jgi:hypothetical protein